jgi:lipid A 3-O-deacylase
MYKKNSPLGWALRGAVVLALFGVSEIAAADQFGIQIAGGVAAHIRTWASSGIRV